MTRDFNPWDELERMRREINRVFGSYGRPEGGYSFPLTNVYDSRDNVVVTAELPGLRKEDVEVRIAEGVLTLSGTRKAPGNGDGRVVVRQERATGGFEKSFRIPTKVEENKIKAEFKNGILTVTMPKSEEVKPRNIAIEIK